MSKSTIFGLVRGLTCTSPGFASLRYIYMQVLGAHFYLFIYLQNETSCFNVFCYLPSRKTTVILGLDTPQRKSQPGWQ